jgi:hypothetical protein
MMVTPPHVSMDGYEYFGRFRKVLMAFNEGSDGSGLPLSELNSNTR